MDKIESFNSYYRQECYEIGTVYSFYTESKRAKPASEDMIAKYSPVLLKLQGDKAAADDAGDVITKTSLPLNRLKRYYGVVVDKVSLESGTYIVVMFCSRRGEAMEYFTKKYMTGSGSMTDGWNFMNPSTCLDREGDESTVVGGITRAAKSAVVGGITKAKEPVKSGVGGITRAKPAETVSAEGSVGGITRAKK